LESLTSMRCKKFRPKENIVKINLGSADRKLRAFVVAPVLIVAGLLVGPAGWLAIVLYILAGVMLATAAVSFCPLYALLGLRTCPLQKVTSASERTVSQ
jgi:Inner membrane protein YgaP-like, transmembrane domain